jgi:hypothetical protein
MHTWSAEQVRTFLEYTADHRLHAAFVLLATTGMRRGEALGLRWSDLDLTAGRLSITRTVIAVNHVIQIGSPKTARARRTVALDPGTIAVLRKHRQQQLEERLLMGSGFTDHDLLFCRPDGGPLHPERFARTFQIEATRAGLPRIRLHDLRHTWATLALVAGEHPKVVQERLGHANVSITLEIYIATSPRACMAPLPTASLASPSAPPEGAKKAPVCKPFADGRFASLEALQIRGNSVREGGFEPPRPCGHWHLKPARLPFRHSRPGSHAQSEPAGRLARPQRGLCVSFARLQALGVRASRLESA